MKKIILLCICFVGAVTLFAQNEQKEGDDMVAAGNYSGAEIMYRLCMEQDEQCLLKLFRLIQEEKIKPQSTNEFYPLINPLAQKGNAQAQFYLGLMYFRGFGVAEDNGEGLKWIRKSVEQNFADAQNELGMMYQSGLGVKQDYREAVDWYQKSAEQGNADAQFHLGYMYQNQLGVDKTSIVQKATLKKNTNFAEAEKWYKMSAEKGHAKGQYNLARMYQLGATGVSKNIPEAVI
jgi:TPR repeat protein